MDPRVYRDDSRKLWLHAALGIAMMAVPLAASMKGLLLVLFLAGCLVAAMAAIEALRRAAGLSEYVRVSSESVDYVNPLNKSASVSLRIGEITGARYEKKPFGLTKKSTEMCAVLEHSSGRKLTLTERFLPAQTLEALVQDVRGIMDDRATSGPKDQPAPAEGTGGTAASGGREAGADSGIGLEAGGGGVEKAG